MATTTHVTITRYKESGKYYDEFDYLSSIPCHDIPALKAEYADKYGIPDMNYTIDVKQEDLESLPEKLSPWTRYLVIVAP